VDNLTRSVGTESSRLGEPR